MFFLTPRYIKEAKQYLHGAKKFLAYKCDILPEARVTEIEALIADLRGAMRSRNRNEVSESVAKLDEVIGKSLPAQKHGALRENIEVFLVAIVIAARGSGG